MNAFVEYRKLADADDAIRLLHRTSTHANTAKGFSATLICSEWNGGPSHAYGGAYGATWDAYQQSLTECLTNAAAAGRGCRRVEQTVLLPEGWLRCFDMDRDELLQHGMRMRLIDRTFDRARFVDIEPWEAHDEAEACQLAAVVPDDPMNSYYGVDGNGMTHQLRRNDHECVECGRKLNTREQDANADTSTCERCTVLMQYTDNVGHIEGDLELPADRDFLVWDLDQFVDHGVLTADVRASVLDPAFPLSAVDIIELWDELAVKMADTSRDADFVSELMANEG